MIVDSADLIPLLEEMAALPSAQQQVFLFCLSRGVIHLHSSDIQLIAIALGYNARTVQRALFFIRHSKILSKCIDVRERKVYRETVTDHV